MKESFQKTDYPGKDKVISYLRSGTVDMVSAAAPVDVFTGEKIAPEKLGMNDGTFMWWDMLSYYVERYNLRLPEEFERHILQ